MVLKFDRQPFHNVDWLRDRPVAHRGLHDPAKKIYENTLTACAAAVRRDYAIEVDLQPSADGVPMVFHDFELDRMTGIKGEIREKTRAELREFRIMGTNDGIPTLRDLLELVAGDVGLVIELKGRKNADKGFVSAVARELNDYKGDAVIMSFYHHLLRGCPLRSTSSAAWPHRIRE